MKAEIVARSIPFAEGPVWCNDGTVVATSVAEGALYRIWPEQQRTEGIAVTRGGANAAAPCSDGGFLVTQNGGVDYSEFGVESFNDLPKPLYVTPSIQKVTPGGDVRVLTEGACVGGLNAPNDLITNADGTLFFTDPGHARDREKHIGRVFSLHSNGVLELIASDFSYCNGIVLDTDNHLVVVEKKGLQRVFPDGSKEWVIENLGEGGGDGFCVDAAGRFYVASTSEHGIRVVDTDGTIVDFLEIPGQGMCTNCCFGGEDGRTLYVTDAIPGNLGAFEDMPTEGLKIHRWPG